MCLLSLKCWSVPLPHNLQGGGGSQFKNEAQVMHGSEMKMQICMCEVPDGLRLCNAGQKHFGGGGGGGSLKSFGTVLLICICYPFISVEKWAECG